MSARRAGLVLHLVLGIACCSALACERGTRLFYRAIGPGGVAVDELNATTLCDRLASECGAPAQEFLNVCLTATPDPGEQLLNWGCSCASASSADPLCSGAEQCDVSFADEEDHHCAAFFCTEEILSIDPGGGSIQGGPQPYTFYRSSHHCTGDVVQLTAIPRPGFVFDHWTGDAACIPTGGASVQVTMDTGHSCQAVFRQPTLSVVVSGAGSVSSDTQPPIQCSPSSGACQQPVAALRSVTLTALRKPGAAFLRWGGDCPDTGLSSRIAVDVDKTCTASFGSASPVGVSASSVDAIVSLADDESLGNAGTSAEANHISSSIGLQPSADASQVAFVSKSTNLVPGATAEGLGYIRDRVAMTTERFSPPAAPGPTTLPADTGLVGLSADGRRAIYNFYEQPTGPFPNFQLGLFDRNTGLYEKISHADPVSGILDGWGIRGAALSANGRFVAYRATIAAPGGVVNGIALRDTCFGAAPQEACAPHTVPISLDATGAPVEGELPQISGDGRLVYYLGRIRAVAGGTPLLQPFLHDRDADGDGVFDEPGATADEHASPDPTTGGVIESHLQTFSIDASGRYLAFVHAAALGRTHRRDTCKGAPPGCAPSYQLLSVRFDGNPGTAREVHLSGSARFAALLGNDSLLFGTVTVPSGTFGVVRDTCLGAPAGCLPANHEVTVRASDLGRGNAFNQGLVVSQDGGLGIITGQRSDYFGGGLPDATDLIATLTGFTPDPGSAPAVLKRNPSNVPAGSSDLIVTIEGTGFVPGAVVQSTRGSPSIVFVSREKLQVLLETADLAAPRAIRLQVVNPGGGSSSKVSFVVN